MTLDAISLIVTGVGCISYSSAPFDYGYERVDDPVFVSCVHPQIIGQAHHMLWYERLIEYIASKDGVWFATCDQIADAWVDDEGDKALMERSEVGPGEPAPPDSGWA